MPYQPKPSIKLAVWVLLLLSLVLISSKFFRGPLHGLRLDPSSIFDGFRMTQSVTFLFQSEQLSSLVQNNLNGKEGEFAIYIEDLNDAEVFSLRSSDSFPAASLYKLYLMVAVLKEIESGQLTMDSEVSADTSHLISVLGSTDYGYEGAPSSVAYSVQEALERVGRISDNFASIMLAEKIGWDSAQAAADSIGARGTSIHDPIITTASDTALFFKKLYKKQVVSPFVSDKVIEFLSLNQLGDRIPAHLPEGTKIIHKTGELARLRHDAGIVYLPALADNPERAYVIVMMSQNLEDEDVGVETMAQISKDVYDYFVGKKK